MTPPTRMRIDLLQNAVRGVVETPTFAMEAILSVGLPPGRYRIRYLDGAFDRGDGRLGVGGYEVVGIADGTAVLLCAAPHADEPAGGFATLSDARDANERAGATFTLAEPTEVRIRPRQGLTALPVKDVPGVVYGVDRVESS